MKLKNISEYLNDLLKAHEFKDYCPNGIQVEASQEVTKIATGVSASMNLFKKAKARKADLILTHHGLFWNGMGYALKGIHGKRVGYLFNNNISLMSYHLPLDAHEELGNNALLAKKLKLKNLTPIAMHGSKEIGLMGSLDKKLSHDALCAQFPSFIQKCFFGKKTIKKIALVSGGATNDIYEAYNKGADLFISGETKEPIKEWCREAKMNFLAIGHYRSEVAGIKALGEHLAEKFSLRHEYIEIINDA